MLRRRFLQSAGVTLTLPALESLGGAAELAESGKIKRFLLMTDGYGFHTPNFYPETTGKDYRSNPVVAAFESLRNELTLLGNLHHLSGHGSMKFVASGPPQSTQFGDSVDQIAARHLSKNVPIDSLLLSTRKGATGGSFRAGTPVAMMNNVDDVFDRLFTKGDVAARDRKLSHQQSVLDLCRSEAKTLSNKVSTTDRRRLDEYLNSIRETEKAVQKDRAFLDAPDIDTKVAKEDFFVDPSYNDGGEPYFKYLRSQLKFVELAFQFDLTRVAYLWEHGRMHGATHHGNRESAIGMLTQYAQRTCESIAETLTNLKNVKTLAGNSLLDETLFVWTAALGSAAKHTGVNTPAILAGGRLACHGQYVHFDELQPTTSLHLTTLQTLGVPAERFSDSTKTLDLS